MRARPRRPPEKRAGPPARRYAGEAADGHVAQDLLLPVRPADDLLERGDEFPLVVDQAPQRGEGALPASLPTYHGFWVKTLKEFFSAAASPNSAP